MRPRTIDTTEHKRKLDAETDETSESAVPNTDENIRSDMENPFFRRNYRGRAGRRSENGHAAFLNRRLSLRRLAPYDALRMLA